MQPGGGRVAWQACVVRSFPRSSFSDCWWPRRPVRRFPAADGRVVFSSGGDLHTVLPDGSGVQALTATPGVEEAQASWSPDGTSHRLPGRARRHERRAADRGDERRRQRAHRRHERRSPQLAAGLVAGRPSDRVPPQRPGGQPQRRHLDHGRRRVRAARAAWQQPGDERYPSLSPDGKHLVFTTHATAPDDVEIAAIPAAGGGAVTRGHRQRRLRLVAVVVAGRRSTSRSSAGRRATTRRTTSGRWPRTGATSGS